MIDMSVIDQQMGAIQDKWYAALGKLIKEDPELESHQDGIVDLIQLEFAEDYYHLLLKLHQ